MMLSAAVSQPEDKAASFISRVTAFHRHDRCQYYITFIWFWYFIIIIFYIMPWLLCSWSPHCQEDGLKTGYFSPLYLIRRWVRTCFVALRERCSTNINFKSLIRVKLQIYYTASYNFHTVTWLHPPLKLHTFSLQAHYFTLHKGSHDR